jgi:hypothetical protein
VSLVDGLPELLDRSANLLVASDETGSIAIQLENQLPKVAPIVNSNNNANEKEEANLLKPLQSSPSPAAQSQPANNIIISNNKPQELISPGAAVKAEPNNGNVNAAFHTDFNDLLEDNHEGHEDDHGHGHDHNHDDDEDDSYHIDHHNIDFGTHEEIIDRRRLKHVDHHHRRGDDFPLPAGVHTQCAYNRVFSQKKKKKLYFPKACFVCVVAIRIAFFRHSISFVFPQIVSLCSAIKYSSSVLGHGWTDDIRFSVQRNSKQVGDFIP